MNSEKSKSETTKEELKDLSKKDFNPKIKESIDKRLKNFDKPVKK